VEIGNIVNTNGDSIDVGFGMERLLWVLGEETPPRGDILVRTIDRIVESGYRPSGKQQGHVLRRLIGLLTDEGSHPNHPEVVSETSRRVKLSERFDRLWPKHQDKSPEWWLDTHGIVVSEMVLRV
jgi:hypothetical protein